jgi:hypothetical protein
VKGAVHRLAALFLEWEAYPSDDGEVIIRKGEVLLDHSEIDGSLGP